MSSAERDRLYHYAQGVGSRAFDPTDLEGDAWDHYPDSYHGRLCDCDHHCGNCRFVLPEDTRRKYCSDECQQDAKRNRALDRRLGAR